MFSSSASTFFTLHWMLLHSGVLSFSAHYCTLQYPPHPTPSHHLATVTHPTLTHLYTTLPQPLFFWTQQHHSSPFMFLCFIFLQFIYSPPIIQNIKYLSHTFCSNKRLVDYFRFRHRTKLLCEPILSLPSLPILHTPSLHPPLLFNVTHEPAAGERLV